MFPSCHQTAKSSQLLWPSGIWPPLISTLQQLDPSTELWQQVTLLFFPFDADFFIYSEAGFVWQEIFCLKFYILLPRLQCSGKQSFMLIHHHPWIGSLSWMEDRHKLTVFYLKMLPRIQCKHLNRSPGRNLHSPSSSLSPSARKRPRAGILRHGFLTCGISLDEHYKAREKFFFGGWLDSWGKGGGPGRACK